MTRHHMNGSSGTVLLVDTDARVLQSTAEVLRSFGYHVSAAASFQEGKHLWTQHRPDILVVDVRLGDFNGLQLLMRARTDSPNLRAIITCPYPDPVLAAETSRFGGTFLVKPFDPVQILEAIERSDTDPVSQRTTHEAALRSSRRAEATLLEQLPFSGHYLAEGAAVTDERRRVDRRQIVTPDFWPERRLKDRRAQA